MITASSRLSTLLPAPASAHDFDLLEAARSATTEHLLRCSFRSPWPGSGGYHKQPEFFRNRLKESLLRAIELHF